MNGKLFSSSGNNYGQIGSKAFRYEGIDYFVGDVVRPLEEDGRQNKDTIIICHEFRYFPMWYASMEYFTKEKYHLTKLRNWDELIDKETFCDNAVCVQIEEDERLDKIITLDLNESNVSNLLDSLGTVYAVMQEKDHLRLEVDIPNMKIMARIIQPEPKEFVFNFINNFTIK